jgi:threonylcarbamoyladenosine tRNA methylthiotransferase MtaB
MHILLHTKKQNPNVKTVLTGCIAQIEKEKLLENPDIDIVCGNDEKLEIAKYLSEKISVGEIFEVNSFHNVLLTDTSKTRASLKIQDGCNNRCSYCIIPFARGKNRSADVDFILEQIKLYEQAGFKEIVLTGIHIGQWGFDFEGKKTLLHLLQQIEEKTSIQRYRLGSLNPLEISDEMLNFLSNSEKFCPHFHLSLQSMCDKTLKSMNRHYSVVQSLELIEKIDEMFNLPFLGSDVIAGFAGESEQDFSVTVENLEKSKLTKIHTFPYSIRKGTVAEKFPEHLDAKTKEYRAGVIKEISARKHSGFLNKNIDNVQEILLEKRLDKKTGLLKGVSKNYINVLVEGPSSLKNSIQSVRMKSVRDGVVYGELM